MNQQDAMAPLMFDCFTNTPTSPLTPAAQQYHLATGAAGRRRFPPRPAIMQKQSKSGVHPADQVDDDIFNRYLWHSIKGDARYPAEFVGGHGKGLKKLGLVLVKTSKKDGDDD